MRIPFWPPRRFKARAASVACALACMLASGCGSSEPPKFTEYREPIFKQGLAPSDLVPGRSDDEETRAAKEVRTTARKQVATLMYAMFGSPDEPDPFAESETSSFLTTAGFDLTKLRRAAGPVWSDEQGKHHGLFRRHCVHCHGVTGDGKGPTALFLNPYPRNFLDGKFKFKSTERSAQATVSDIENIITQGIPGTAMPSFALYPQADIEALAEYVRYLSVRGQVESTLLLDALVNESELPSNLDAAFGTYVEPVVGIWTSAEESIITPPERPSVETPEGLAESIARGRVLFQDAKKAKCTSCHGFNGLGDPPEPIYDDWNDPKVNPNFTAADVLERFDLPLQISQPRNLRLGIFRGGRRPLDVYRRIHAGINGTDMPGAGPAAPGGPATLTPEEIWSLVDYVLSLPYEPISGSGPEVTVERDRL